MYISQEKNKSATSEIHTCPLLQAHCPSPGPLHLLPDHWQTLFTSQPDSNHTLHPIPTNLPIIKKSANSSRYPSVLNGHIVVYPKAMAPHSGTLAWKIPWTEESGRLQSMGLRRVGHDWVTSLSLLCIGEGNGKPLQCSCLGNPRDGVAESDMTEVT